MKIRPGGAELFCKDGQTDMTKLIVTFRNSVNAPEKKYARLWNFWLIFESRRI
jgi:hypothetical protein